MLEHGLDADHLFTVISVAFILNLNGCRLKDLYLCTEVLNELTTSSTRKRL